MSREKVKTEYRVVIKKSGNGAKIKAYKKHIGQEAIIKIIEKEEKEDSYYKDIEHSAGSEGWE